MREEIVVILDANASMGDELSNDDHCATDEDELDRAIQPKSDSLGGDGKNGSSDISQPNDFLGTTKFDVAQYIARELVLRASAASSSPETDPTHILALVTLGGRRNSTSGTKRKRPENTTNDFEGDKNRSLKMNADGGCCCYYPDETDHASSVEDFVKIVDNLCVDRKEPACGDFVKGIVGASNALAKNTTVGATQRRILLVTDARHKIISEPLAEGNNHEDPFERLAKAIGLLKTVGCTLEVIGIGFLRETGPGGLTDNGASRIDKNNSDNYKESTAKDESDGNTSDTDDDDDDDNNNNSDDDNNSDGDSNSSGDSDDEETVDDWSDIQEQNELLLVDLVDKIGGSIQAVNCGKSLEDFYGIQKALKLFEKDPESPLLTNENIESESEDIVEVLSPTPMHVSPHKSESNECDDDDAEIQIIASTTINPNIQYPHKRFDCGLYDFSVEPKKFCDKCYCAICDIPAKDCKYWEEHYRQGVRDCWSLQRSPGTRIIRWNGSDDVLLPEWIKVARPSLWNGALNSGPRREYCPMIRIDDPLQPLQHGDNMLQPPKKDISRYIAILEQNFPKVNGLIYTNQHQCFETIQALAKADECGAGRWLVHGTLENADTMWEKIATATAYGKLGPSSTILPTKHLLLQQEQQSPFHDCSVEKVPCWIGVEDSTNRNDIRRILNILLTECGVDLDNAVFEPDILWYIANHYGSDYPSHFPRCWYTAHDVLSWVLIDPNRIDKRDQIDL